MKQIKKLCITIFSVAALLVLVACGDKTFTVTFETFDGSIVSSQEVVENDLVVEPENPTKEGYVFDYWYVDSTDNPYDFSSPVDDDLTISALFVSNDDLLIVNFDSTGGSDVSSIATIEGHSIGEPEEPTRENYVFMHWSVEGDTDYIAFDFSNAINNNLTLVANWKLKEFTVTFDSRGGSNVESVNVVAFGVVEEPSAPEMSGSVFGYWYLDDENTPFDFTSEITSDITLSAHYYTDEEIMAFLNEDALDLENNIFNSSYELNIPEEGRIHGSDILWYSQSEYISDSGVLRTVSQETFADVNFVLINNNKQLKLTLTVALPINSEVEISNSRDVDFYNLTTEYDVADSSITLYYEENGSVPYVKVDDFLNMLNGFIDPELMPNSETTDGIMVLSYDYYDEEEDHTYNLILEINANDNTITTNDPAFYWAYVYSTETNYGRHIVYDNDNPNAYYEEGQNISYNLNEYFLDMAIYEGDVVLPYYLVNQLFAGSSYYNVYYNSDALYGIYSLPSSDSDEYTTMKTSSLNGEKIPSDLLVHTYNMLAFDMDYFYGLKDMMGIDTYYDVIEEYMDELLNPRAGQLEIGIFDFLIKSIDEPHTSYGYPSYYNNVSNEGPSISALSDLGARTRSFYTDGLYAVDDAIFAKWEIPSSYSGWGANSPLRPYYWFLDESKTAAVLILDDFYTADITESNQYDADMVSSVIGENALPMILGGTKYFFYNSSSDTDDFLEILVKGLDENILNSYDAQLISAGYSKLSDDDGNTYYSNGESIVSIDFDTTYELFYVGVSREDLDDGVLPFEVDIMNTVISDSAVYMEVMLEKISGEAPNLEDVILDLTFNTGGNVGALYRVVGFVTDQPFAVSRINEDTNSKSTSYVKIEGVPSYSDLQWSLLTSPATFSAANAMATIFKENDLGLVIGEQSGGGAASITPILLPNGTAFTMSSNSLNAYRTGSGTELDPYVYVNNEMGIAPDVVVSIEDIYDETILLDIINE